MLRFRKVVDLAAAGQVLNTWIRGRTDVTVVDFERALGDPSGKHQRPETESLDGVHPGPGGYEIMARTVPLDELTG